MEATLIQTLKKVYTFDKAVDLVNATLMFNKLPNADKLNEEDANLLIIDGAEFAGQCFSNLCIRKMFGDMFGEQVENGTLSLDDCVEAFRKPFALVSGIMMAEKAFRGKKAPTTYEEGRELMVSAMRSIETPADVEELAEQFITGNLLAFMDFMHIDDAA